MIYRVEILLRRLKRFSSRTRFVVWLFGLSKASGHGHGHGHGHGRGLIMLQIDGLSHRQLERALASGSMPFTKRLLSSEHYRLHSLYSGVPSSTPAVQGELFYGVRNCVPAFSFKRPQDKRAVTMLDPGVAAAIESALAQQGEPLLQGGSSFSNIFTGGASESSFCAASIGWDSIIPSSNIFKMLIFGLLNIVSFMRVLVLIIVEMLLAVVDFIRGVLNGRNLVKEMIFVPTRVAVSVLLRELVTIGVNLDSARGVPVIHANFIGYDEQAHRRGPESRFAHWSLQGIDKAMARIWHSARQSEYREYDIWIYSDHGQESISCYPIEFSRSIQQAAEAVIQKNIDAVIERKADKPWTENQTILSSPQSQRIHLLGIRKLSDWFTKHSMPVTDGKPDEIEIAAMGPLGFIYAGHKFDPQTRRKTARELAEKARIPIVMLAGEKQDMSAGVSVWTPAGEFHLPADKAHIFGAEHPFLDDVCNDFIELCQHPYAGDFVISGWRPKQNPISFRIENGAHAGPGINETHAFALLPEDTPLPARDLSHLRVLDLNQSALDFLGRGKHRQRDLDGVLSTGASVQLVYPAEAANNLRVMTYNVHSCTGMDGKISPRRIARVIAMYNPDVVALQELVVGSSSHEHINQAILIADELKMNFHFHPVKQIKNGQFGNAILSRHAMRLIEASALSSSIKPFRNKVGLATLNQPRGALHVEIDFNGLSFRLINTHLGLTPEERREQVVDLIGSPGFFQNKAPAILCGDLNAAPYQKAYQAVRSVMNDAQTQISTGAPKKTFPSRYPSTRIDHIFVDKRVKVNKIMVPANHLTKVASDHLPLIADLDISGLAHSAD